MNKQTNKLLKRSEGTIYSKIHFINLRGWAHLLFQGHCIYFLLCSHAQGSHFLKRSGSQLWDGSHACTKAYTKPVLQLCTSQDFVIWNWVAYANSSGRYHLEFWVLGAKAHACFKARWSVRNATGKLENHQDCSSRNFFVFTTCVTGLCSFPVLPLVKQTLGFKSSPIYYQDIASRGSFSSFLSLISLCKMA